MFLDTYLVEKYITTKNLVMYDTIVEGLKIIDEKQGLKQLLALDCMKTPLHRKTMYEAIQATHKKVIVVDDVTYSQSFEYVNFNMLANNMYSYDVFIFNYQLPLEFYNKPDFLHLREQVALGNKMALAATGTKVFA